MFDFLRRNRVTRGPHEFGSEIEIPVGASTIYPLLDPANALFHKRQLGEQVTELPNEPDTFRMVLGAMPDLTFWMKVLRRDPGRLIEFESVIEPRIGRLDSCIESYEVSELGPDLCRIELTMTAMFQKELSMRKFEQESWMMSISGYNALAKIALLAEHGPDAVRQADQQTIVGIDDDQLCGR